MSGDSFTETSSTGWFGRIGNSIKGVLFGIVLIVVAVPVLFFNEGRAVKTKKSLDQGAKEVVTVSVESPEAANDGKLVYFSGEAKAEGTLEDAEFKVTAEALKLRRAAEYYQWDEDVKTETKKKLGGGEETVKTYNYTKKWSNKPIDSSNFKRQGGHQNPSPAVAEETWTANPITVGEFTLSSGLVGQIGNFTSYSSEGETEVSETIAGMKVTLEGGTFYLGENPGSPEVGDIRVTHKVALPGEVSVVAAQAGTGLEPFTADAGGTIDMLEVGKHSAASMFEAAQQSNTIMTWVLRGVGILLMFIGFSMLFKPLSVLADVVPLFGTIVGAGTGIIAFLITIVISFFVISVAWIFYRPLIGIPLILVAVAGLAFLIKTLMAQKKRQAGLAPS